MLGPRTAFAAAAVLVVGLLGVAAPAHAGLEFDWQFAERPTGLPAGSDPARTLVWASAHLVQGEAGEFDASVELGAVPDESTGAALRIALGQRVDGECVTNWEQTVPVLDPGGPASRDGSTITIHETIGFADYSDGCGSVALLALAGGAVLDRLDAPFADLVVSDPLGRASVTRVSNRAVEPNRWSTVWLRVDYAGGDADGLIASGQGARVTVRRSVHDLELAHGEQVWVPVQVRLRGHRARRVTFQAAPYGDLFRAEAAPLTVRLRPLR